MIPPTSSYYNPDDIHQNDSQGQYQQWLDSFNGQQQQQQQQQVEYSSAYRRPTLPAPIGQQSSQNPYTFMQGQYGTTSMGQYAASTSETITQATVSNPSTYQSQTTDMYSTFYPDMLSMTNNSSASSPENAHSYHTSTPESTSHSYSNTPDPVYQQQQFNQHQQPAQLPSRPIEQKTNLSTQSSQFLHPQTARYLPQRSTPEFGTPASNSNASSHASSLSPPPNAWTSETVYPTKKPVTSTGGRQPQQPKVRDSQASAGKAGPSQINAVTAAVAKRPDVSAKPTIAQASPPRASRSAPVAAAAAGAKRKRAKKDDGPEWSNHGSGYAAGDASDSESDDDDDESGLGRSGPIGVGLDGLGVVRREKKENRSRL